MIFWVVGVGVGWLVLEIVLREGVLKLLGAR